jgi:photosystem II stability/assembly factor-like uncharacterized protein
VRIHPLFAVAVPLVLAVACAEGGGGVPDDATRGDAPGATDAASPGSDAPTVPADVTFVDAATPTGQWFSATGSLTGLGTICGTVTYVSSRPDTDVLIAGVVQQGLWASTNGGMIWSRLGTGAGSATVMNGTAQIVYDPRNPATFWEAGSYFGPGVFRTDNGGATFVALGDARHNDSISVDFTDPARRTLLVGVHETAQAVYRSTDGGATWTNVGTNLPASAGSCTEALVLDAQTHLVGCWQWDGSGGIWRTTDGGQHWSRVEASTGVGGHALVMPDGAIYWARRDTSGLLKSTDQGRTWTAIDGRGNFGALTGMLAPIALPGGQIAVLGPRGVVVSRDGGSTWRVVTPPVPARANGMPLTGLGYSPHRRVFYASSMTCGNGSIPVPADSIMGFAYDYEHPGM